MKPLRSPGARALAAACSLVLAACTVGPDFKPPRADVPPSWSAAKTEAGQGSALGEGPARLADWWKGFGDPVLDSLIERAAAQNLDLRAAGLRIAEARAARDVTASSYWPALDASASYASTRISEKTATTSLLSSFGGNSGGKAPAGGVAAAVPGLANPFDQFQYGFDASWEADLFGRVRRSVEAADASAQASLEDSRGVFIALAAETARGYIELRGAQQDLQITRDSLATQRDVLELVEQRRRSGLATDLDVANAAAVVAGTEALLPLYDRRTTLAINELCVLLAQPPGALRPELERTAAVPPAPPQVPLGLPADLLRRRPDIRAAEARLHAATAQVGAATASFFPDVSLNLGFGFQAERARDLADWASHFLSLGPSVDLPIFDGGRHSATVRLQDLRAREAATAYAAAVLNALQEVENSAAAYNTELQRRQALRRAVVQEGDALLLSRQRYRSGLTDFLEVLEAERSLQQAQLAEADSIAVLSTDLVALYKALGGGWGED